MFVDQCVNNVCIRRNFHEMWQFACMTTLGAIYWISPCGFISRRNDAEVLDVQVKKFAARESVAWAERTRQVRLPKRALV